MTAPQEAIAAAVDAIWANRAETRFDNVKEQARAAVEAAAPHIAAAERERILTALPSLIGSSVAKIVSDALGDHP